jgi:molybdopterin/thiamine biosynthesis adenylyltransferase/rhodanese-related sulfurtransferase
MKTYVKPDNISEVLACSREKDLSELQISIDDAKDLLRSNDRVILVDVRSDGEMCLGSIEGARLLAPGLIEKEADKLSEDKDVPILVYCSSGDRSLQAAEKLRSMGFSNARSIAGGFTAWLNSGAEMVIEGRFTVEELDRYSRNMLLSEVGEEGQVKLMNARVLMVGAGGLASSAGLYLAACGVGTLGIADFDRVELSNLNRQVIHRTADIGSLKVDSAKSAIERINPNVKVIPFNLRLTPDNAPDIISDFDIVMDASDNIDTKFLLNDACFFAGKPYVFGGAVGFDGQAGVFWPKAGGPCLRCLFPKPPPQHLAPT